MTELRPCSSCNRHFFVSADACPFCDAKPIATRPPQKAGGALLAGALLAGATMLGTACGKQKAEDTTIVDSNDSADDDEEEMPDGADDDEADEPDPDPDREEEREMPPYGAPPFRGEFV